MERKRFLPILDRKTPILDLLRGSPEFKERPLFGILAETPEEIRNFRRGLISGFGTALAVALFLAPIIARVPTTTSKDSL